MKIYIFHIKVLLHLLLLCAASTQVLAVQKEPNENKLDFLVVSDIHISDSKHESERLKSFVEYVNDSLAAELDFVVCTGDNVSYLLSDRNQSEEVEGNNKLRQFVSIISGLNLPFYLCMGNHEYKIDGARDSDGFFPESEIMEREMFWKNETGFDARYSDEKKGFKLIFLNSMRGRFQNKFYDDRQLEWFKNELESSTKVILFQHHPVRTKKINNWYKKPHGTVSEEIEPGFFKLLRENRDKVLVTFVGHGHQWMHDTIFESVELYETASFGDHDEFMYYKVSVAFDDKPYVSKSVDADWFMGF